MKLALLIPTHNEEHRIKNTLICYSKFFLHHGHRYQLSIADIIVVLNGCTDGTYDIVQNLQQTYNCIRIVICTQAGKGVALRRGFEDALTRDYDLIGFVDADMATAPEVFAHQITVLSRYDGVIASRYMPGAKVTPPRPFIKRWGSRLIYEPLVYLLLGLSYYDLQCGSKVFTRKVIATITPHITIKQWAIDAELLYLCKLFRFSIREIPTIWHDQPHSKLTMMHSGLRMLRALFTIRSRHAHLAQSLSRSR